MKYVNYPISTYTPLYSTTLRGCQCPVNKQFITHINNSVLQMDFINSTSLESYKSKCVI